MVHKLTKDEYLLAKKVNRTIEVHIYEMKINLVKNFLFTKDSNCLIKKRDNSK